MCPALMRVLSPLQQRLPLAKWAGCSVLQLVTAQAIPEAIHATSACQQVCLKLPLHLALNCTVPATAPAGFHTTFVTEQQLVAQRTTL
jgi:hypothetical protein